MRSHTTKPTNTTPTQPQPTTAPPPPRQTKPPLKMEPTKATLASSIPAETLATYAWIPDTYKAAVFLIHGFRAHAQHNFLRSDSPTSLNHYGDATASSLIRE